MSVANYDLTPVRKKIMTKKLDLEDIPIVLTKIVNIIDNQIDILKDKEDLDEADQRMILAYSTQLNVLYKDYRAEVLTIEKELKTKSKEDILNIVKAEAKYKNG